MNTYTQLDPLVGRTLEGRWQVTRRLGEGAMGTVYLASQRSVGREVALKTLRPQLASNPEFARRFLREARVGSSLTNPHCVTLHDFGQTPDGLLYFVMEYLRGQSLAERIQRGQMSLMEILEVCMQITSALSAAHQKNIIHRDLKPDNIFLLSMPDQTTFVKVLDFGIAKMLGDSTQMTHAGQVHGTPLFMSPEQCRGQQVDGRSDLYSLGCILYYMLTCQHLFYAENPLTVMLSHVHEPVPAIEQIACREDIPAALVDLCIDLLQKEPDRRPQDAPTVRMRLKNLYDQLISGKNPPVNDLRRPGLSAAAAPRSTESHLPRLTANVTEPESTALGIPLATPGPPTLTELASRSPADSIDALPRLSTPSALYLDLNASSHQTNVARPANPSDKWWMLALALIALIVATGTIAAIATWLAAGSPDLLAP